MPKISFGQVSEKHFNCHDTFTETEIEQLIESIEKGEANRSARTTAGPYRVSVRATVFHESSIADKKLTTEDVRKIITHANTYFSNINVELVLQNDNVNHIAENEYVNFKVNQETALRAKYDVTNAINLYFFKSISTADDIFLNGSAALPNFSNNSNRIFLSYLDRNNEDFETLKNKVFLHELGHYFGLLHTFQNSNDPDVLKRELVSRDIGSIGNCHTAGDYICDTPADPFERLVSISSYNCNEKLPDGLVDALGYTYTPPTDNIMSYQVRCGNIFTSGQYQRMEQSFAIRFSPKATYNIIGNQASSLIIDPMNSREFCAGETVKVQFTTYGDFNRFNNFSLQISDATGKEFRDLPQASFLGSNEFITTLDGIIEPSSNYRFRVISKVPYLESTVSEQFTIHTAGELKLSLANSFIRPGESSTLFLDFSGSGPWEVVFENGITLFSINSRSHRVSLKPLATSNYKIISATGKCGAVVIKNSVTLSIAEPAIVIKPEFEKKSCQEMFFQLPVSGLKNLASTSPYRIKLINADTTILLNTNLGQDVIFAAAPKYRIKGSNDYQLIVEGPSVEDYSLPSELRIFPKALLPITDASLSYCFNSDAKPLQAVGTRLKWYLGQNDLIARNQIIPSTLQPGVFFYYVTQTNEYGCESSRKEAKVVVKTAATAEISGNKTIKFGDKTVLSVKLKGEAPWNFELSDGQRFETAQAEFFPEVQPNSTETYTLRQALNACGEAFLTGSARIVVLQPLSSKQELISDLKVFPNPVADVLTVELQNSQWNNFPLTVTVVDMMGRTLIVRKLSREEISEPLTINVTDIPGGTYQVKFANESVSLSKRIFIVR